MPGRGKRGGAKAGSAQSAKQAKAISAWLSRGSSSVAAAELESVKMGEDMVETEPAPEVAVVTKKAGRGGRRKSSPTKPEKAADEIPICSESSMDSIEAMTKHSFIDDLHRKIGAMEAKAAEPILNSQSVGSRTRGASYRYIPPADPETAEVLKRYEAGNLEEDDDLIRSVLGGSPSAKSGSFSASRAKVTSPKGFAPNRKIAKLEFFEEKPDGSKEILPEKSDAVESLPPSDATSSALSSETSQGETEEAIDTSKYPPEKKLGRQYNTWANAKRHHKGDVLDALIMHQKAYDRYSKQLEDVLDDVKHSTSPVSSQERGMDVDAPTQVNRTSRVVVSLDRHEEVRDGTADSTKFYLPFFSPSILYPLPSYYLYSAPAIQVFAHLLTEEDLLYLPVGQTGDFSMAVDSRVPGYVQTLNRLITQPNAITKLSLFKYYLRRMGQVCPKHIVYWLLSIVCFSKHHETAFEAYDLLLSLHQVPIGGAWPARIAKAGSTHISRPSTAQFLSTATKKSSQAIEIPALVWNFPLIEVIFQTIFGAGSATLSYVTVLAQSEELRKATATAAAKAERQRERLARQLKKGVAHNNMIERLEQYAEKNWQTDDMVALGKAMEDAKRIELMKNENLNSYNFSLFSLLFAAALHSSDEHCVDLNAQELITCINGIYRALVDASCQNIISDLEVLLRALLTRLFSETTQKQIPIVLQHLCESLWMNLPINEESENENGGKFDILRSDDRIIGRSRHHSTISRWCYLTPCSSPVLKQVRSGMAWYFLRAMDASFSKYNDNKPSKLGLEVNTSLDDSMSGVEGGKPMEDTFFTPPLPQYASPKSGKSGLAPVIYKTAHAVVDLPQVCQWLNASKLPKIASAVEWAMYADWVLLLDIASASFDVSELSSMKKYLTQWDVAFAAWQKNAKEKSNLNLSMARFKDISTLTASKFRLINNSIQREATDPFASFKSPKKTSATTEASPSAPEASEPPTNPTNQKKRSPNVSPTAPKPKGAKRGGK